MPQHRITPRKRKVLYVPAALGIVLGILLVQNPVLPLAKIGVTFADFHAENFGLDPHEVYTATLDDLGVRDIRLAAYWDRVERTDDAFDFTWLDWYVDEAAKRDARVVLAVGRKLPRWPECFIPDWAEELNQDFLHDELLEYIARTVNYYKDNPTVTVWQVENEPFLPFGHCPAYEEKGKKLDEEIALVRSLDQTRPILVTDSGELSLWVRAAKRGDIFGTTMYRRVWNKYLGYVTYPIPPSFFRIKHGIAELFVQGRKPAVVIELQGEPWYPGYLPDAPLEEQARTMDTEKFIETLEYAKRSGFDTFYLWGVEWWYWMREAHGDDTIWEYVRGEIQRTRGCAVGTCLTER